MNMTSTSGNQAIISNGNSNPQLTCSSGILTMNSGSSVAGSVSIGTTPVIITWVAAGASSEIDTNGVLYVSGSAGTTGFGSGGPYIAHAIVNFAQMNISRVWGWTNSLAAGDLKSAITQCGKDFAIHTPYTP